MSIGLRVIRGRDWSSGECDGGEGHLGTVVQVDKEGTVDVIWDNGQRRTCAAGKGGKFELRIFDNATVGSRHMSHQCSECEERGIFGMRWSCKSCSDVHLCSVCYVLDKHRLQHEFKRFDYPGSEGVDVKKRSACQRSQAMGLFPGARVVRGDDWKWEQQDGGRGNKGTVISMARVESASTARSLVKVKWDKDSDSKYLYRVGHDGKMDLKFVEESPGIHYYKDHLPHLDVTKTTKSSSDLETLQVGNKVCIQLTEEDLRRVQADSGGWTAAMSNCIGKFGTVKGFTGGGDVLVEFEPHNFRFYPGALRKVSSLSVGDVVRIMSNEKTVQILQNKHGGWNKDMSKVIGKVGKIVKKDEAGNVVVAFGKAVWVFNPACCIPASGESVFAAPATMQSQQGDEDGPSGLHEALLQLLGVMLAADIRGQDRVINIDALYQAIAKGSLQDVRSILSKDKALLHQSHRGVTPLILASHEGQTEMVSLMLDNGANIEIKDHKGNTALSAALIGKREVVAKLLIERGANVKVTNNGKQTCLHMAAWANLSSVLQVILQKGCDINAQDGNNDTALHDAIHKFSQDCVRILLKEKALNLRISNNRSMMPLQFAALRDNVVAVELIIQRDKSVVPLFRSKGDVTALHIAAANDHVEIARLLIEKGGCPVDIAGSSGLMSTPLHVAGEVAYYRISELLAQKGANLDAKDSDGDTALHYVLGCRRSGTGAEMPRGEMESRVRLACFLMENNATYNLKNKKNKTPIEVASHPALRTAIEVYLENHKADLKARPISPQAGRRQPISQTGTLFDIPLPCSSCFKTISDVTLKPCGHRVLCRKCCVSAQICPMCQTSIELRIAADSVNVEEVCKVQ